MSNTPGLQLPNLTPSQSGKSVSVNVIANGLDGALTQQSIIDMSGGSDVTPSTSVFMAFMVLKLVGILTANIHLVLNLPGSTPGRLFLFNNATPYRPWTANTAEAVNNEIIDNAGHIQKVTGISSDNLTGATMPTFNDSGSTTTDNHVTWTDQGVAPTYTITVKCGSGTMVVLNPGDIKFVYCDGTNCWKPN
jgi:hypothetical protein